MQIWVGLVKKVGDLGEACTKASLIVGKDRASMVSNAQQVASQGTSEPYKRHETVSVEESRPSQGARNQHLRAIGSVVFNTRKVASQRTSAFHKSSDRK
jgi:hypothetical protein